MTSTQGFSGTLRSGSRSLFVTRILVVACVLGAGPLGCGALLKKDQGSNTVGGAAHGVVTAIPTPPVDSTSPTILSVSPEVGATGVSALAPVVVTLSKNIDPTSVTDRSFQIVGADGNPAPGSTSVKDAVITFTPSASYGAGKVLAVRVSTDVKDLVGNMLDEPKSWTFTSAVDATPPTNIGTSPLTGATAVALNQSFVFYASKALQATSVTSATVTVLGQGGTAVPGTLSVVGNAIEFKPTAPWSANTEYTATVTTKVVDTSGNPFKAPEVTTFTTGTAADMAAPTIASTSPANGATNASVNPNVVITLSKDVDINSAAGALSILDANNHAVAVTPTFGPATVTYGITTQLQFSSVYTAHLSTQLTDSRGNAVASATSWSFTTGAAPTVLSSTPASASTNVAGGTSLSVTFSDAMDPKTFTSATAKMLDNFNIGIPGTLSVSGSTLTFTPAKSLSQSRTFTLTLTTGVRNMIGNPLAANVAVSFSTVPDQVWESTTKSIFAAHCLSCHTFMTDRDAILSESSLVNTAVSSGAMPRGGSLTGGEKSALLGWVTSATR